MQIVRARPEDATRLTEIAFAAKRHWKYPEAWIESWREDLTINAEFLRDHETYVAMVDNHLAGFYAFEHTRGKLELSQMWVLPEAMGRGVGRALFRHAVKRARALGFHALEIESDPNAEGFYLRMGARRVGSNFREVEKVRRELPVLIYDFNEVG
jgi:GNAT superfamily N-acetyltransferase